MNTDTTLVETIKDTFRNINTEDWFQYVPQSEVVEKMRTSHTQLNRYIDEFPNVLRKYKLKRKVFYKKTDINNLIENFNEISDGSYHLNSEREV